MEKSRGSGTWDSESGLNHHGSPYKCILIFLVRRAVLPTPFSLPLASSLPMSGNKRSIGEGPRGRPYGSPCPQGGDHQVR